MAFNKYRDRAVKIIDKYLNEEYYLDGKDFDLFTLFDIPRDEAEFKNSGKELIRAFHPDNLTIFALTDEQEFVFNYLSKYITSNFSNSTMLEKANRIDRYQNKIRGLDSAALENRNNQMKSFFSDSLNRYQQNKKRGKVSYIIKRFLDNKIYLAKKEADIFKLFEIDKNATDFEKQGTYYKELFTKDNLDTLNLTDEEEYSFKYISKNLIPQFDETFTFVLDKLDAYEAEQSKKADTLKKIEEVKNEKEFRSALEDYKNNKVKAQKQNEIMTTLIMCSQNYGKSSTDPLNYFAIFSLPITKSNQEILSSSEYQKLKDTFETDNTSIVHEAYIDRYKELRIIFLDFNSAVLNNDAYRQRYEDMLKNGSKQQQANTNNNENYLNSIMDVIIKCSQEYDKSTSQIDDYFAIFCIPIDKTNQEILASRKYQQLRITFETDNTSIIPEAYRARYQELRRLFHEFNKNVIKNDVGRKYYEQLLRNSSTKAHQNPNSNQNSSTDNTSTNNSNNNSNYQKEVNFLMKKYIELLQRGDNFDFYDFFNIDIKTSTNDILKNQYLQNMLHALKASPHIYGITGEQEKIYNELASLLTRLLNETIAKDEARAVYDCSVISYRTLKQKPQGYVYQYTPYNDGPKGMLNYKTREAYENVVATSLSLYGATNTVLFIKEYIENGTNKELDYLMVRQKLNSNGLPNYLRREYGHSSSTLIDRIADSVSDVITKRVEIFEEIARNTANAHGIDQAIYAIRNYAKDDNTDGFHRRHDNIYGREDLLTYIPKPMLAIVTGAILNESYPYLLDDINDSYGILTNNVLNTQLVNEILYKANQKRVAK